MKGSRNKPMDLGFTKKIIKNGAQHNNVSSGCKNNNNSSAVK